MIAALVRSLARRPPPGMSLDDARLAGIVPPGGWELPRAPAQRCVVVVDDYANWSN